MKKQFTVITAASGGPYTVFTEARTYLDAARRVAKDHNTVFLAVFIRSNTDREGVVQISVLLNSTRHYKVFDIRNKVPYPSSLFARGRMANLTTATKTESKVQSSFHVTYRGITNPASILEQYEIPYRRKPRLKNRTLDLSTAYQIGICYLTEEEQHLTAGRFSRFANEEFPFEVNIAFPSSEGDFLNTPIIDLIVEHTLGRWSLVLVDRINEFTNDAHLQYDIEHKPDLILRFENKEDAMLFKLRVSSDIFR